MPPTPAPNGDVLPYETYRRSSTWYRPVLPSVIGIDTTVGGGVMGFTDRAMRDELANNVGGLWNVRVALGTHIPLGVEIAYTGTAAQLQTFSGVSNGTLLGTAVEGMLRWNLRPDARFTPYFFGGMGWQRYTTVNAIQPRADSGMKSSDDIAEFPVGGGLSFRGMGGFTIDVRGTFHAATDATLLLDPRDGKYASLHTWEAGAAVGYEF